MERELLGLESSIMQAELTHRRDVVQSRNYAWVGRQIAEVLRPEKFRAAALVEAGREDKATPVAE